MLNSLQTSALLEALRNNDPELVELAVGCGAVLVSPALQGRVFCHARGELIHRLDVDRLERPAPDEFNNVGGNSLWPAPEGGPFAFNYPPESSEWYVQGGIANARARVVRHTHDAVELGKDITLVNRAGTVLRVRFNRRVTVAPDLLQGLPEGIEGVAYRSVDALTPLDPVSPEAGLIAAWSLEQIGGAEGVTAFGKVQNARDCVNGDYYGDPRPRLRFSDGQFTYALGGDNRQQIGVTVASRPSLIGALDSRRGLLITRRTEEQDGVYFNIADNDQPGGPYSSADLYSIFNGGDLGFFELETIAPMRMRDGALAASELPSETVMLCGTPDRLTAHLREGLGVNL